MEDKIVIEYFKENVNIQNDYIYLHLSTKFSNYF